MCCARPAAAACFGLITTAMVVVIVAIGTFGPNVRGKPLDA
jgi:putative MFS transporter